MTSDPYVVTFNPSCNRFTLEFLSTMLAGNLYLLREGSPVGAYLLAIVETREEGHRLIEKFEKMNPIQDRTDEETLKNLPRRVIKPGSTSTGPQT